MSTRSLIERAHSMLRTHIEIHGGPVAWWKMSTATADAMTAETPGMSSPSSSTTLFGRPLVLDDSMDPGVIDLVPDPNYRRR